MSVWLAQIASSARAVACFVPWEVCSPTRDSYHVNRMREDPTIALTILPVGLKVVFLKLSVPCICQVIIMASISRASVRFASYSASGRRFFIGGNWKANGSLAQIESVRGCLTLRGYLKRVPGVFAVLFAGLSHQHTRSRIFRINLVTGLALRDYCE